MATSSMQQQRKRQLKAEINVVPYIDVMLVLLVIFMVTAPLLSLGVDVKLPQVNAATIEQPKQHIIVQIDSIGGLSLIQSGVRRGTATKVAIGRDELVRQLARRANDPDLVVFVAGHHATRYELVLEVLQLVRTKAHVTRATLLTQSVESSDK